MTHSLPTAIVPILEKFRPEGDLEFWNSHDPDAIDDFVALAHGLALSNIDTAELPLGYSLIEDIFHWESSCQMSGWYALENMDAQLDEIISAYRAVGLEGEADGLTAARSAWSTSDGDDDATGKAYAQVSNPYRDESERWSYLFSYFKENAARLMYEERKQQIIQPDA